jgi:hypothetical protein
MEQFGPRSEVKRLLDYCCGYYSGKRANSFRVIYDGVPFTFDRIRNEIERGTEMAAPLYEQLLILYCAMKKSNRR